MNRSALTLTVLLPALCAASAAAQVEAVRFSAPLSPMIVGLPVMLPGPLSRTVIPGGISLPAPLAPNPTLTIVSAEAAGVPYALPVHEGQTTRPFERTRDGAITPLGRDLPGMVIRLSAAAPAPAPSIGEGSDASKNRLDETFDRGDARPAVSLPRRQPVASGRRIGLPEDEFRELGF